MEWKPVCVSNFHLQRKRVRRGKGEEDEIGEERGREGERGERGREGGSDP